MSLSVGKSNFWFMAFRGGALYFRLGGYGLCLNTPSMRPLYSERAGIRKPLVSMCGYRIFALKRSELEGYK